MELILKKPIEEIVPKVIAFNNEELLSEAKRLVLVYENKIYTENSYTEAKADCAKINAVIKALTAARISIDKEYNAPRIAFDKGLIEVVNVFERALGNSKKYIESCDDDRKSIKLNAIKTYWFERSGELFELVKFDKVNSPKWLNATASIKSIMAEIDGIVANIKGDILSLEALRSEDENVLKALYFRTLSLASAIAENEQMKIEKKRLIEFKARQAAAVADVAQNTEQNESVLEIKQEDTETVYTYSFSVTGTLVQIKALGDFIKANNIQITKI